MKHINKILIGAVAVLALASCKKSFLETKPTNALPTAEVFANIESVKGAMNGLARSMRAANDNYGTGHGGEFWIMAYDNEWTSQEFRHNRYAIENAEAMNGIPFTNALNRENWYSWGYYYEIISNANTAVANIDGAKGSKAEKDFYKAQARTFRDYAFVRLLELFSYRWQDTDNGATDGVVMRMNETTGDMPVSSVAKCYELIYKDLDEAIKEYQASGMNRKAGEVWLPNINVAYAVYARAALHKQDYETALKMAQKAREGYPLMSNDDYKAGFCQPTSEWLFGSYDDESESKGSYSFGWMFACNGRNACEPEYGAGDMEKEFTDRVLKADPSLKNDVRMSLFLTEDKLGLGDLYAGGHIDDNTGYMLSDAAKTAAKAYIQTMTPTGFSDAYTGGYYFVNSQLKFWVFAKQDVSYVPYIRSSEMLLIEAEANHFLNNDAAAKNNLIELNKTTGRNPNYAPGVVSSDIFQEIQDYRELELWGEGFNWYDYKRWNKAIDRKGFDEGGNCFAATAIKIEPAANNKWTRVVPSAEYMYNHDIK